MEHRRKNTNPQKSETNILICALIGGGIGLALSLMLALIMPMAIINSGDPNSLTTPLAAVCIGLGGMTGAVTSARKSKDSKFLAGMLSSAVILVPLSLVSFLLPQNFNMLNGIISVSALMLSAFLGAFATSKTSSNSKKNMKKAMKRR